MGSPGRGRVTPTPLFTRSELARAFALLLPADRADELATRWFDQLADKVDALGRFVYPTSWSASSDDASPPVTQTPDWSSAESVARDEAFFQDFNESDADERFLRLGDLHLALVALLDEDLYGRMLRARGMTEAGAARNRLQLQRAVRAYRRSKGWPPAV